MPNPDYVFWHATDTILKDIYEDPKKREKLTLLTNTGCRYLEVYIANSEDTEKSVTTARCYDYLHSATAGDNKSAKVIIEAEYFVIAAGAIGTPQVFWSIQFLHHHRTSHTSQILFNTNKENSKGVGLVNFFPNLVSEDYI